MIRNRQDEMTEFCSIIMHMSTPPPFLEGEKVILRPLTMEDAEGPYAEWFNDAEVCRGNSHHVFPYTKEKAQEYIRHATNSTTDLILAIQDKKTGKHVGNIALQNIHPLYRKAEFAIILGDKEFWGKGYGREAATLMIEHGFKSLNLQRIECGTIDGNDSMKKLAGLLGMKEEGKRRNAVFKDGEYKDVIEYGLLKTEFPAAGN